MQCIYPKAWKRGSLAQSLSTKRLPYVIVVHLFYALDAHVVEDRTEEALMLLKYMAIELADVELVVEL